MKILLRVPEAAEQLRLSDKTLWAWIARKQIGVHRVGRSVRIAQSEVDRIIEDGAEPARTVGGSL